MVRPLIVSVAPGAYVGGASAGGAGVATGVGTGSPAARAAYICSSSEAETDPTLSAATAPPESSITRAGIALIPHDFSSEPLSLTTGSRNPFAARYPVTVPSSSLVAIARVDTADAWRSATVCRSVRCEPEHGSHQVAQKYTTSGPD